MITRIYRYVLYLLLLAGCRNVMHHADVIFYNGKIVTVDEEFSIAEAVAIKDGRFMDVGSDDNVLKLASDSTRCINLNGRTVIPGIIDNHLHPVSASLSEFNRNIPDVRSMDELLNWIYHETCVKNEGEWIIHPKIFITRLREMRQPTLAELDSVTPDNPVFLNGSYGGMINTRAIMQSDLMHTDHPGILRDKLTGKPTGFIRSSAFRLLSVDRKPELTEEQKSEALKQMFALYNEVGITSICSGLGSLQDLDLYQDLMDRGELSVRIYQNMHVPFNPHAAIDEMREAMQRFEYKTGDGDEWIKIGAIKIILDGGILTGTAFLSEPWGEKANEIFGVTDPDYRGELNFSLEELVKIITVADEFGWKFTSHVTGGGGVDMLLSAMEEVNKSSPLKGKRFSLIHGNFFTPEAIRKMVEMDIYADMQPAWFYKDTDFLHKVIGIDRIKSFHPYNSLFKSGVMVNGGSDHMVKLDCDSSINPYNPFLAMWTVITRKTDRGSVYYPEEAISRKQALQMYTINNAFASFEENLKGSIEVGKLADLVVLTDDILTCPEDAIRDIKAVLTVVHGKIVYSR